MEPPRYPAFILLGSKVPAATQSNGKSNEIYKSMCVVIFLKGIFLLSDGILLYFHSAVTHCFFAVKSWYLFSHGTSTLPGVYLAGFQGSGRNPKTCKKVRSFQADWQIDIHL
jgi:hypothetical protein